MICVCFWVHATNFDISNIFNQCEAEDAPTPPKDANMM